MTDLTGFERLDYVLSDRFEGLDGRLVGSSALQGVDSSVNKAGYLLVDASVRADSTIASGSVD